jgi:hypothetical protein
VKTKKTQGGPMLRGELRRRTALFAMPLAVLMTGLLVVASGACGSSDPAADTTTTTAAATATTAAAAPSITSIPSDPTASTASASEPTGEIGATASVTSTNGAYPTDTVPDWSQIKSVAAYRDASMAVASLFVSLATYDVTAGSISEYRGLPYPPAGQARIELLLTRTVAGENEPPLVTGSYDFNTPQGQAELTGAAAIILPNGSSVTFAAGALECDVQVTAISETEVSGTYHVKDEWTEISGTFTAPVK